MQTFFNSLVRRVFPPEPDTVIDVPINDYVHYDRCDLDDSLCLLNYTNENNQINYEVLLNRENSTNAFSLYRSTNAEEALIYFLRLKGKLPILMRHFPAIATTSTLQLLCKYINSNPTQNLAHICAYFDYADYFKQLALLSPSIRYGSGDTESNHIDAQDENGKTPLQIAIERERRLVVQSILSLEPKYDLPDNEGNNILHCVALTNRDLILMVCNAISSQYNSALLQAAATEAESEAPQQPANEQSSSKPSPVALLHLINLRNRNNFTPLYLACVSDKPECVKELLKFGADVNGASISDQIPQLRHNDMNDSGHKLISKLSEKDMKNGGTPLHWNESVEVIEMLVDMHCDLNASNFHGDTALHLMIARSNLPCVIALLSHGANVNAIDVNGNTPLHLAIKTNDISIVQAVIVFGANVDAINSSGESARHLAATSAVSPTKDVILYMLNAVGAKRCPGRRTNCNEGCSIDFNYNGIPPENCSFLRNTKIFDEILMGRVVHSAIEKAKQKSKTSEMEDLSKTSKAKKRVRLLSLDGGGIRGLILIQVLAYFEKFTSKTTVEMFDMIAGTSTGGIFALLLASGYTANECFQIYFRLKDKVFMKHSTNFGGPYCSDTFERFLRRYLGENCMKDLTKPRVMIPVTVADRFPPDIKVFRNYPGPNDLMHSPYKHDPLPDMDVAEEQVWKVARATGAAPTYFSQYKCFLDGGLISNNPTLDLLSEVQNLNQVNHFLDNDQDMVDIDIVVSVGTGAIPTRPVESLNFAPLFSFAGLLNIAILQTMMKVLVEQATQADGQVVERAQSWCSSIGVPYFRINPPISEDIQLDESDSAKLVNMLWETMAYLHRHKNSLSDLLTLLML